jgi:hypothetical protein
VTQLYSGKDSLARVAVSNSNPLVLLSSDVGGVVMLDSRSHKTVGTSSQGQGPVRCIFCGGCVAECEAACFVIVA